jgi:colanic acid/amylovoran biosynthesis glycosyltransferase
MMARDAASLDLTYALSRHPQAISTFVNGEAAVLARRVGRLSIVAEKRSDEADVRPGGIPASVDVRWTPTRGEWAFWRGSALALARGPSATLGAVAAVAARGDSLTAKRRWAYSALAAAAETERMPRWRGRRHIHAHFAATGGVVAFVMSRVLGVPYSVTAHGSADLFRANPHLDLLLREAAFVAAVSGHHRDVILERVPDIDSGRVHVVHVGVRWQDLAEKGAEGAHPPPGAAPARIVSVGNLVPMKGMDVLVEAVGRLVATGRELELEIVGDGPEREQLEDQVRHAGLTGVVRFLGQRPPAEAHAAMRRADLFALACLEAPDGAKDGVPTVLMEAMASGRPVISTRLSGIPELIDDGGTGWLVPPDDADALAAGIADALDHPDEAGRRALAGQAHVEAEFDQERNALRLLDLILAAG